MTRPAPVAAPAPVAFRHAEHLMGTVFSFAVRPRTTAPAAGLPFEAVLHGILTRLHRIDEVFSTYRADSQIRRLERAELTLAQCDPEVAEVLARCREVAAETDGWFTHRPAGRLDPSGWVKGWAVEEASLALSAAGWTEHSVSGGGDVQTSGGPWRIGIAAPFRPGALLTVLTGHDLAVATSGIAERGRHILDPHTGRPAEGLAALTLTGRRIARTDAWATAAFAMGPDRALAWATARPDTEALAVLPDGTTRITPGLTRYLPGSATASGQH
ncbi:thiamine biosynthesis protein [Kitasatospora sp. MMS16-BH015]|uniref:FAD:protein FMN transferase n=1 Tax=Kitasatospora sp. MMS16-BH015 TaxID=2018025 RepID=UPI000CA0DF8C|nr:FAD:protein FMN transferase [Kitasatospora sp. MMS16-BH015]AUG80069.1 thiamine biosynthesis protein [Kitasatospora sp. MMS16-BH015]